MRSTTLPLLGFALSRQSPSDPARATTVLMRQAAHVRLRNAVYRWVRPPCSMTSAASRIRRSPGSWASSRPSAPLNRRSIARRRLRHARNQNHLQSKPPPEKDFSRRMIPLYKRWGNPPADEGFLARARVKKRDIALYFERLREVRKSINAQPHGECFRCRPTDQPALIARTSAARSSTGITGSSPGLLTGRLRR